MNYDQSVEISNTYELQHTAKQKSVFNRYNIVICSTISFLYYSILYTSTHHIFNNAVVSSLEIYFELYHIGMRLSLLVNL